MTSEALQRLVDEVALLESDVAILAGESVAQPGVVHLPTVQAARRLTTLTAVLDAFEQVEDPDVAVIGRRVTVVEEDGESVSYALVFPGDGDPLQGWISADSPLGAALVGARPGDRVEVAAPAGTRTVSLATVE